MDLITTVGELREALSRLDDDEDIRITINTSDDGEPDFAELRIADPDERVWAIIQSEL